VRLGRPDGYLTRQVARWAKQWEATRIDGMEALDALAKDLAATVPASQRATIVHGDYRLDNTMLDPMRPGRIAAVLDWEMCTLGDPLADLGILLVYWQEADDGADRDLGGVVQSATVLEGFPQRTEVARSTPAAAASTSVSCTGTSRSRSGSSRSSAPGTPGRYSRT
jgi:aminoglycoside phosphotransferase (APT) family kinase protein